VDDTGLDGKKTEKTPGLETLMNVYIGIIMFHTKFGQKLIYYDKSNLVKFERWEHDFI
jgi:hypothetical protein